VELSENKIFADLLRDNEPCALSFQTADSKLGYGVPYRVKYSCRVPEHLELFSIPDNELVAVLRNDDPHIFYFNLEKLRKPEKKIVYVVTRSDGVRKEFSRAYDAVQSGAVDEHVLTDMNVCASTSIERIMYDMELAGLADTDFYRSLDNLSLYARASEDTVFEFWEQYADKGGEHHYCDIDTWGESYLGALKYMANVYGWKVEVEERYE